MLIYTEAEASNHSDERPFIAGKITSLTNHFFLEDCTSSDRSVLKVVLDTDNLIFIYWLMLKSRIWKSNVAVCRAGCLILSSGIPVDVVQNVKNLWNFPSMHTNSFIRYVTQLQHVQALTDVGRFRRSNHVVTWL